MPSSPLVPRPWNRLQRMGRRPWATAVPALLLALASVQCTADVQGSGAPTSLGAAVDQPASGTGASQTSSRTANTPRVSLRLKQQQVASDQRARAKVRVRPRRTYSPAQVQSLRSARIRVQVTGATGSRTVRTRLVHGRRLVRLPRLGRGVYRVQAVFPGNELLGRAASRRRTLTVVQAGGTTSGWPGPSNTGVPPGTTLTPYRGSCTITSPVTIDAKTLDCPGAVSVRAAGVVIKNSKINGRIVVDTDVDRTWSLTLTDSEVDAGAGDLPAIFNGNVVIERSNIYGGHNGLECQEHSSYCVLRDSWIHDQWQIPTTETHLGGFLALGVEVPCTRGPCVELVHNTIVCDAPENVDGGGCTGDINLIPHFGPLPSALIENNFLGANTDSAACTFGGAGVENPATNIVYRDNVFQRGVNRKCAAYGPVTAFDHRASGNVWANNRYEDGVVIRCDATHDCG